MDIIDTPKFNKKEYNKAYLELNLKQIRKNIIKCLVREICNAITQMQNSVKKLLKEPKYQ